MFINTLGKGCFYGGAIALPGQMLVIEKFDRLNDQKDALIRKLERSSDKYRALVYRRLIERVDRRIKLIATDLPM